MRVDFRGVGVALITPFLEDGTVDFTALEELVERVIAGGVDYLVVLGTTAETATLSEVEKEAVVDCIVQVNDKRLPLVIGIGGNNTADLVEKISAFDFTPFDALLSVTPYYNKPSQEGLYQHYKAVAEASPRPVILYNVPGRTGVNMSAQTTLRLAHDCPNVMAVKEASGNLSQANYILRDRPEGFLVISGDDNLTLPMIAVGGDGVISVAANAYPEKFSELVHSALEGDLAVAAKLQCDTLEATDALFVEGNPVGVKAALAHYGLSTKMVRLPLVVSTEALDLRIGELLDRYELK